MEKLPRLRIPPNRSIISIEGVDSISFLQGLISQDVRYLESFKYKSYFCESKRLPLTPIAGIPTLFLSSSGRILADGQILHIASKDKTEILLDIHSSVTAPLLRWLQKHAMRSAIKLTERKECSMLQILPPIKSIHRVGVPKYLEEDHENSKPYWYKEWIEKVEADSSLKDLKQNDRPTEILKILAKTTNLCEDTKMYSNRYYKYFSLNLGVDGIYNQQGHPDGGNNDDSMTSISDSQVLDSVTSNGLTEGSDSREVSKTDKGLPINKKVENDNSSVETDVYIYKDLRGSFMGYRLLLPYQHLVQNPIEPLSDPENQNKDILQNVQIDKSTGSSDVHIYIKKNRAKTVNGITDSSIKSEKKNQKESEDIIKNQQHGNTDYNVWRMLCGIPEGHPEVYNQLPFFLNFDFSGFIVRSKGCYIGQELMSRTINLSPIRKRLFLAVFNPPASLCTLSADKPADEIELPTPGEIFTKYFDSEFNLGSALIGSTDGLKDVKIVVEDRDPNFVDRKIHSVGIVLCHTGNIGLVLVRSKETMKYPTEYILHSSTIGMKGLFCRTEVQDNTTPNCVRVTLLPTSF